MTINDRTKSLGRACRHFLAREAVLSDGQCCKIGHPIRKIVTAANGGSIFGIAYMFPCRPGPERKADCPDYDPKTDEEVEAEKARMRDALHGRRMLILSRFDELRGKNLACWCKPGCPCHADTLLEVANA